jgi:hypothetical protein
MAFVLVLFALDFPTIFDRQTSYLASGGPLLGMPQLQ